MLLVQPRPHAQPEGAVHDGVGVAQVVHDAVFDILVSGLAQQVAGKQQAGANLVRFEVLDQVGAAQGAVVHDDYLNRGFTHALRYTAEGFL